MDDRLEEAIRRGDLMAVMFQTLIGPYPYESATLYLAIACGHLEIVKFLAKNRGINYIDKYALQEAVYTGDVDILKFLVENVDDIHADKDLALGTTIKDLEKVK